MSADIFDWKLTHEARIALAREMWETAKDNKHGYSADALTPPADEPTEEPNNERCPITGSELDYLDPGC